MLNRSRSAQVKEGPLREELKRFRCCALFPNPLAGRGLGGSAAADKARERAQGREGPAQSQAPAERDKGISPGHLLIGRPQTSVPSARGAGLSESNSAAAADFAHLDLSSTVHDVSSAAARLFSGAGASVNPYSSQPQHQAPQPPADHYLRQDAQGGAALATSAQRPPQHQQPHRPSPPDALSSQCILQPRRPLRSLSGPTLLDSAEATSSPGISADIRPQTPDESQAHRAPHSGPEARSGEGYPTDYPPYPSSHPYANEPTEALEALRRQSIPSPGPGPDPHQQQAHPPQLDAQALTLAGELRKEGIRLMQVGQNAAADIVFTEGLRCNPGDAAMLSCRVTCRSRLGRHADAMRDAYAVTELVPDWHRGHFQVGVSMEAQGRYEEAATAFDRAVSLARLTASDATVLREYMRRLDRVRWLARGHTEVLRSVERIMKKTGQKPPTALQQQPVRGGPPAAGLRK